MELRVDGDKRELKDHGTYGFPVYADRKKLSSYGTGSFPWHWHDEVELTLVLEGEIDYRVNGERRLLKAGEGLFCNAGALHSGFMVEGSDCDYISLTFHPRLLWGFDGCVIRSKYVDGVVGSRAFSSLFLSPEVPWQKQALESVSQIYRLCLEKPELYELEAQRLLLGIWAGLYRGCGEKAKREPPEDTERIRRLKTLLAFLHRHYGEKITLEDAARQVNLSKSECCRFFKGEMGKSLFDYLLDYRVGQSMSLLKAGAAVSEAGAQCGFSSPAYFAKVFRERTGRSPREYRKEMRDG